MFRIRIKAVYREPLDFERLAAVLVAEAEELEKNSQPTDAAVATPEAVNE